MFIQCKECHEVTESNFNMCRHCGEYAHDTKTKKCRFGVSIKEDSFEVIEECHCEKV